MNICDPTNRDYAFQNKTTYLNDYKRYIVKSEEPSTQKLYQEIKQKPSKPRKHIDNESLCEYKKNAYVPFTIYHSPKPIINKPYKVIDLLEYPLESKNYEVIKSRPRFFISPGIPIDDIEDIEKRNIIMKYMYTTEWESRAQTAALPKTKRDRITPESLEKSLNATVELKTEIYTPLAEPFLRRGQEWDDAQTRNTVDPTRTFWINKDPPVKCGACVNPLENIVPQETKNEIRDLIKEDKLRGEHDVRCSSYAGYIPNYSDPVPLAKTDFPISWPYLSISQILDIRKKDKTGHKIEYK